MHLKKLPLLTSILFALSMTAFAQDNDQDTESAQETEQAAEADDDDGEESGSYDGSNDSEFANDEDYASAYARYKTEGTSKAEINRARTEGFARTIALGAKVQGGINTFLIGEDAENWTIGYQFGGGLMVKMPLGVKNLSIVPELTFNYRYYGYNEDTDYGKKKAEINIVMVEIPLIVRYTLEDWNMYFGLGVDLGLKFTGSSEFEFAGSHNNNNPVTTSSVEVGGTVDIGYMLNRWLHMNVRVTQCFTNILNLTLTEEFRTATLNTFYTTVGLTYLF